MESAGVEDTPLINTETVVAGAQVGATFANSAYGRIKKATMEGPVSYRVMAFIGGLAMIASNAIAILDRFFSFHFAGSLIAIYCMLFGVVITILEGSWSCPHRLQDGVRYYAKFLEYTWGRGMLYVFVGTLQISNFNMLDWAVGGYMIFVGFIAIGVGMSTSRKLKQLKRSIESEEDLRAKWAIADVDKNGHLDLKELVQFCDDSGLSMTRHEVAAAFLALDKNFDEKVTFEEFYAWWVAASAFGARGTMAV